MCTTTFEEWKKELSYPTQENIIPVSLQILKKTTKKVRTAGLRNVFLPEASRTIHFTITLRI